MADPRIGVRFDFSMTTNVNEVMRQFKAAVKQLGTGPGAGAEYGRLAQAAAGRVRELGAQQKLPQSDMARLIGQLRDFHNKVVRKAGPEFSREARQAGLKRDTDFALPKGYDLRQSLAIQKAMDKAVRSTRKSAAIQEGLSRDPEYKKVLRQETVARKQIAADLQAGLARSKPYKDALAQETVARQRLAAGLQTRLLDEPKYTQYQAKEAIARQRLAANLQGQLADKEKYKSAVVDETVARRRIAADTQTRLADSSKYQDYSIQLGTAQRRMAAATAAGVQTALYGNEEYKAARKQETVARQRLAADLRSRLAEDPNYNRYRKEESVARQRLAARLQRDLSYSPDYREAKLDEARSRQRIQARSAEDKLGDDAYMGYRFRGEVARTQMRAQTQTALANDPAYNEATAQAASAKQQQAAKLQVALAGDDMYIAATAQLARARQEQAAREQLARVGQVYRGDNRQELLARAATAQRTEADIQAAATAKQMMAGDRTAIQASAQRRYQENLLSAAIRQEERQMMRGAILRGEAGGSTFQRLQAYASPSGRAPTEYPTGGQAFTQKTLTSGGYMVGSMVTAALMYGTLEAIKAAGELQEKFAALQGQMNALGAGNQFSMIRDEIKGISNETGQAATAASHFFSRILGVTESPTVALLETEAAMKLMTVAGVDMSTMIEEVVPITKAFGVGMDELGDIAVGIRDKFGVAEDATLHFLGETASTMKEAGFEVEEAAAIGAAAANSLGKSASVVGEQFSKVLGTISNNQTQIIGVFRRNPATAGLADPIIEAFSKGDTAGAFKGMLAGYSQLDAVQKSTLVRVSGSRREWQLLNGMFQESGKLLNDINDASLLAGRNGAVLDERFAKVSATLNRSLARVRENFSNLIEGLFSSGLGTVFDGVLSGLELVFNTANGVIAVFNRLNEATKFGPFADSGLLQFLTQAGLLALAAVKIFSIYNKTKAISGRVTTALAAAESQLVTGQTASTGTTVTQTAAVNANTAAKGANTTATTGAAAANTAAAAGAAAGTVTTAGGIILPAGSNAAAAAAAGQGLAARQAAAAAGQQAAIVTAERVGLATTAAVGGATTTGLLGKFNASRAGAAAARGAAITGAGAGKVGGVLGATGGTGLMAFAGPLAAAAAIYGSLTYARNQVLEGTWMMGGPGLLEGEEWAKKQLGKASTSQINNMAVDRRTVGERGVDRMREAFFDVDSAQTLIEKEQARRIAKKGSATLVAVENQGALKEFARGISTENLGQFETWVAKSDTTKDLMGDLGIVGDDGKVNRDKLAEQIPALRKKAEEGDQAAARAIQYFDDVIARQGSLGNIRNLVDRAANGGSKQEVGAAIEAAGSVENFLNMQYDPKGALEAGEITPAQYIAQTRENVELMKRTLAGQKDQEAGYRLLNQKLREAQQYEAQILLEEVARITRFANMTSNTPKAVEFDALVTRIPKMGIVQQLEQLPSLYDKQFAAHEEALSLIQDPNELFNRTVAGMAVNEETRRLDIVDQVRKDPTSLSAMSKMATSQGTTVEAFADRYARLAAERGVSFKEALRQDYQQQRDLNAQFGFDTRSDDAMLALIDSGAFDNIDSPAVIAGNEKKAKQAQIQSALRTREANLALARSTGGQGQRALAENELSVARAKLNSLLEQQANGTGGVDIQADITQAQAAVNDAVRGVADVAKDTHEALLNWAVVAANGDPIAETDAQIAIALYQVQRVFEKVAGDTSDPEYIKALQNVETTKQRQVQNYLAATQAAFQLMAFDRSRNSMQALVDQLTLAQMAVEGARGAAARDQALLQVKQAERAIDDKIEEDAKGAAQLAITLAEVRQDPDQAKRLAADDIRRQLTRAKMLGLHDDEIRRLTGELANAEMAIIDQSVQSATSLIDYMLEMGQITQSQAIERLKVERDKYEVGTQKWRDLQLRIRAAEKGAQADAQFNLPDSITLPTLYEARRANQSRLMGLGYLDSRTTNLTVNVNGAQNPEAITNQIVGALQAATGGGPTYTPGISVGMNN